MIKIALSVKFRIFGWTLGSYSHTWTENINVSGLSFPPIHFEADGITLDITAAG